MRRLKIGDVVALKSGSQAMTVRCEDPNNSEKVRCNWYFNGEIKEESFYEEQLESAEKD